MFEKEFRLERDVFGRLRLAKGYSTEAMFFILIALAVLWMASAIVIPLFVPLVILIKKPKKISFWTYFIWLLILGIWIVVMFFGIRDGEIAFTTQSLSDWTGIGVLLSAFLLNFSALVFVIRRALNRRSAPTT